MENEIRLFYNGKKQRDKEVVGYAKSMKDHELNEQDITKTMLTERQLAEIAKDMNCSVSELIDTNEEKYLSTVKNGNFSDEELLKLMSQNPELIESPIAYMNGKAFVVKSQYSFVNEDIEVDGIQSKAGNKFEK